MSHLPKVEAFFVTCSKGLLLCRTWGVLRDLPIPEQQSVIESIIEAAEGSARPQHCVRISDFVASTLTFQNITFYAVGKSNENTVFLRRVILTVTEALQNNPEFATEDVPFQSNIPLLQRIVDDAIYEGTFLDSECNDLIETSSLNAFYSEYNISDLGFKGAFKVFKRAVKG
ncbi:hypothetical protein PCE1_003882 [Barthelona sp. PCE]